MQRTNKKKHRILLHDVCDMCARVWVRARTEVNEQKKNNHTHEQPQQQQLTTRSVIVVQLKYTLWNEQCVVWSFTHDVNFFSYIYAYVLVCMQIGRRRRLSLARAQTAIKHKIREEDSKWSKAKKTFKSTQRILCTHSTLNDFYTLRSIHRVHTAFVFVSWLVS